MCPFRNWICNYSYPMGNSRYLVHDFTTVRNVSHVLYQPTSIIDHDYGRLARKNEKIARTALTIVSIYRSDVMQESIAALIFWLSPRFSSSFFKKCRAKRLPLPMQTRPLLAHGCCDDSRLTIEARVRFPSKADLAFRGRQRGHGPQDTKNLMSALRLQQTCPQTS